VSVEETIAATARRLEIELAHQLARRADDLADEFGRELQLVAWDRQQVIGRAQSRLRRLRHRRPALEPGARVTVVERSAQPLESLELLWGWLRRGRAVQLQYEAGTSAVFLELVRRFVSRLPAEALQVAAAPMTEEPAESVGVHPAGPRVALIHRDADRELAAYVLARTCLRRCGFGPRAVHRAYVVGPVDLLRRHLGRLWVGVQLGRADDPTSFAGPVTPEHARAYLAAYEAWSAHPDAECWAEGGPLHRTDDERAFVAPAIFGVTRSDDERRDPDGAAVPDLSELPVVGPLLIVSCGDEAGAERALADNRARGGDAIAIGGPPRRDVVRHVRGALLVERLPPGLPDPRPV
jgi:hypothetical protein